MAPPPPPPPPPGPGAGRAPGPPPPPGPPAGAAQAFRIVPGLGEALHGAMKKISGVEEIAPAAEGVASESTRHTSTPTGAARPRSWHGTQVPGKPKISRPLMSEMENRLARRRDKVDAEAYVSEGPDPVALPPEPACLPPSGAHRKPSTASVDSGRGSLEPGLTSRSSLEPGGYARVTVDQERKEELMLAKAVRRSSAKMLSRDPSPSLCSPAESPETVKEATPDQGSLQPASQVVLRYWQQCSSTADSGYFGEEGISMEDAAKDSNGDVVPPWRSEAIEGEEQDFPSIAAKIKQMEEEAKRPLAMYEVPDVKSKMKTGAPAAKWMEARGKLQLQLDTLIHKTSEKMAKYGSVHAREKEEFVKDSSTESETAEGPTSRPPSPKEVVDKQVKTLIKTVANEIQKSFSMKSIHTLADEEEEEDEEEETEEEREARERKLKERHEREKAAKAKKLIKEVKRRQKHIDMEAPILDFELKEPTPEPEDEEDEEYDEGPIDLDHPPGAIDFSAAKSKVDMRRKSSTERRLPAGVLAKKKAAEKAKEASGKVDASTATDSAFTEIELMVAEKLRRKEMFSDKVMQTQWDISNAEYELSKLSDNEKAEMLTKQISKMKSTHINKLLKSIDTGILDISLPLLVPFLSLQVRMSLGTDMFKNRFKAATPDSKNKMVKETFVDMMIKDITDIALLQEVIERSQEKLHILAAEDERRFAEKLRSTKSKLVNVENDSFELGSSTSRRSTNPDVEMESPPAKVVTPKAKEATPLAKEATPSPQREASPQLPDSSEPVTEESKNSTTTPVFGEVSCDKKSRVETCEENIPFGVSDVASDDEEAEEDAHNEIVLTSEVNKSNDSGCPTSESDDDKDDKTITKEVESDEGIDNSPKVEAEEAPKENQIKKKILNILQDAKAMDQKRNIRNYGRTFEFQGVKEQLRPVLPNDRRPQKAKRLDCMWSQVTAAKQRYAEPCVPSLEELKAKKAAPTLDDLKSTPRSSVPWTRKGNAQPAKKEVLAAEKEVEEFESCRKTLKDNVKSEATEPVIRQIHAVKKEEIVSITKNVSDEANEKVRQRSEEKVKSATPDNEINNAQMEVVNTVVNVDQVETKLTKDAVVDIVPEKEVAKQICISESATAEVGKQEAKVMESASKVKAAASEDTAEEGLMSRCDSAASESSSEVDWEESEEEVPVLKEQRPEKPPVPPKPVISTKEIPSLLLMSPAVRRRGDVAQSSTSVSVSTTIRLPPPPSFRPPPPPLSPPVPAATAKEKLQAAVESESEWEYETESEEE